MRGLEELMEVLKSRKSGELNNEGDKPYRESKGGTRNEVVS